MLQCCLTETDGSGCGFGSWKSVAAVPVPFSKILGKKGKTLKKTRNSSKNKKQGNPKRQGKENQGRF